jgi:PKD repeat protein
MKTSRRGIIGITLAVIMITSAFAAIAPITADVQSQDVHAQSYSHAEKIADRANKTYHVGELVTYYIKVYNDDPNHSITFNLTDTYAHDAPVQIATNVNVAIGGNWSTTYPKTIAVGDLDNIGGVYHVFNAIYVNGTVDGTLLSATASVNEDIIILYNPPSIDFSFNGTDCNEVTFDAWAITDGIDNWTWDFGSGESPLSGTDSFPITVKHTFNSCGSKTVKLTACNYTLCANVTKTVNVACGPTAVATYSPDCFEENGSTEITFDGSGSTGASLPLSYKWGFTGGFSGDNDGGAITHVWVTAPVTATLTVTDKLNCTSSTEVSVGPCPDEVPTFTPLGMVGLVTVLSALALFTIKARKRR